MPVIFHQKIFNNAFNLINRLLLLIPDATALSPSSYGNKIKINNMVTESLVVSYLYRNLVGKNIELVQFHYTILKHMTREPLTQLQR